MNEDDDYKPARIIEQTDDYHILDWGEDGQGIYCMHCAWISFGTGDIENRYCPMCKVFHADRPRITPLAPGIFMLHGKKDA